MSVLKIAGLGLMGAVLAITVKKYAPEMALQVSLATGVLIALLMLEELIYTVESVREFVQAYPSGEEWVSHLLKVTGIAYISEFTGQLLRDAGQNAIGTKVETAGKIMILGLGLPLLTQFADIVFGLL